MRGNCTTEDEPDTADYDMLVQPEDSLVLFVFLRERASVVLRAVTPRGMRAPGQAQQYKP